MATQRKAFTWAGWIIAALIALMLLSGVIMSFVAPEQTTKHLVEEFGYPEDVALPLIVVETCCLIVYLVPRTAVLGAILLTGYLGGAVATHVRVHDNFVFPVIFGIFVWLSVYLRDPRVRALLPISRRMPNSGNTPI